MELLVVICILGILIAAGASIMTGLGRQTTISTAEGLGSVVDLARSKATGMNTYARVAIGSCKKDGRDALAVGIFASKTSTFSANGSDWEAVVPPLVVRDMAVEASGFADVGNAASNSLPAISSRAAGAAVQFANGCLISPAGMLSTSSPGSGSQSSLGLRVKNLIRTNEPSADLLVATLSGSTQIISKTNP